ncbi:MAG: hypothetical protein K9I97_04275 [Cryomorphaceae bacterium]|jgi:hypothetical protein|nr:hypothetical protein [Cryomorphaceae bacterium]
MRTLLFICCFLLYMNNFSQGNLQLNQVLNLSFTSNGNNFSVPAGKVWKIEGVGLSSYSSFFSVSVAGQQVFLKNTHTSYGPVFDSFPYWLNGGQNVFFSGLTSGVASVLEFNIIP